MDEQRFSQTNSLLGILEEPGKEDIPISYSLRLHYRRRVNSTDTPPVRIPTLPELIEINYDP
jgi:hypothetical protein